MGERAYLVAKAERDFTQAALGKSLGELRRDAGDAATAAGVAGSAVGYGALSGRRNAALAQSAGHAKVAGAHRALEAAERNKAKVANKLVGDVDRSMRDHVQHRYGNYLREGSRSFSQHGTYPTSDRKLWDYHRSRLLNGPEAKALTKDRERYAQRAAQHTSSANSAAAAAARSERAGTAALRSASALRGGKVATAAAGTGMALYGAKRGIDRLRG